MPVPPESGPEIPATFSNQVYVGIFGGMIRITFGEILYGEMEKVHPRVAIAMPTDRALALATTILNIYAQVMGQPLPYPPLPPIAPESQNVG